MFKKNFKNRWFIIWFVWVCVRLFAIKLGYTCQSINRSDRRVGFLYRTQWSRCTRSLRWPRESLRAQWDCLRRSRTRRTHNRNSEWPETTPWYCSCSKWVNHHVIVTLYKNRLGGGKSLLVVCRFHSRSNRADKTRIPVDFADLLFSFSFFLTGTVLISTSRV